MGFPSIDEFHLLLEEIVEQVPKDFFKELSNGIVLFPEIKLHKNSREDDKLYIMGEYGNDRMGRHIAIYYGSYRQVYNGYSIEYIKKKLRDTVFHEFTHHLESLAGEVGLEIKDKADLEKYRSRGE